MLTRQAARRRWVPATAAVPLGPANGDVDFFARGACAQPGVDPAIFISDEDDQDAVAAARAACSACPVRLACRLYAYEANPYGVYAGETQAERAAKLQLRARHAADEREGGNAVIAAACCTSNQLPSRGEERCPACGRWQQLPAGPPAADRGTP